MSWLPADIGAFSLLTLAAYLAAAGLLSIYGLHRLSLLALYYRNKSAACPATAELAEEDLPEVLVQLPIFNEKHVAQRLIDAVAKLDWPANRLQVQVLDDSTDSTTGIIAAACSRHRAMGLQIDHVRREGRDGFKAGALAHGMELSSGCAPLIALFDADFLPNPDFLRRTVPALLAADNIGMVQCRWEHLNRRENLITSLQAILLDGHFVIEHSARFRSGRFFNFNGTAGIWRRSAIEDGGGWQGDTLCEDLDLSYRSQMAGWRFVYLQDFEVSAELPAEVGAFKSQQHRWAKGSIQTAAKLLPSLWRSALPFSLKVEATFHLAANFAYPLMAALLILLPMSLAARLQLDWTWGPLIDLPIFICATFNLVLFYAAAEKELRDGRWLQRLHLIPMVLALGASLTVNNTRAVWQALRGHTSPFVRTPKAGSASEGKYHMPASRQAWLEVAFGLYYGAALLFAASHHLWHSLPFLLLFSLGFLYLGLGSLREWKLAREPSPIKSVLPSKVAASTAAPAAHRPTTAPTEEQARRLPAGPPKPGRRAAGGY